MKGNLVKAHIKRSGYPRLGERRYDGARCNLMSEQYHGDVVILIDSSVARREAWKPESTHQ